MCYHSAVCLEKYRVEPQSSLVSSSALLEMLKRQIEDRKGIHCQIKDYYYMVGKNSGMKLGTRQHQKFKTALCSG